MQPSLQAARLSHAPCHQVVIPSPGQHTALSATKGTLRPARNILHPSALHSLVGRIWVALGSHVGRMKVAWWWLAGRMWLAIGWLITSLLHRYYIVTTSLLPRYYIVVYALQVAFGWLRVALPGYLGFGVRRWKLESRPAQ